MFLCNKQPVDGEEVGVALMMIKEVISHHPDMDWTDSEGKTALCRAVESGRLDCVMCLLQAGADPDHNKSGMTPLQVR
jgi:ankyrin repeat protein